MLASFTAAVMVATLLVFSSPAHAATTDTSRAAPHTARRPRLVPRAVAHPKAPVVRPSRPVKQMRNAVSRVDERFRTPAAVRRAAASESATTVAKSGSRAQATVRALATDTTPPSAPTQLVAQAQSISTITAQWNPSLDAESGIASYVFAIGTTNTGTPTALANVRWWQVTYTPNISVNLSLDPNLTYYVSVQATNGAGLVSPIVTSGPVRPVWTPLGQTGNVLQLRLAPTGIDTSGNPTTGWTPEQAARMTAFFNQMYPILVARYGPPADSYTVTAVRDLRYSASNVFFPSLDEIHMDDAFYPQLFTHELVHAFRNDRLLSSDASWNFNSTLSPFEESFAQSVSYDAMNDYVAAYPYDSIVAGTSLFGSSNDWDYDFQNVPELKGTDFWSEGGGTGLYWTKYEMGAAAIRKIELESPGFARRFNAEYYRRINANPTTVRPTRALIVDIIKTLVPQIEGRPATDWVNAQHIFYAQNVLGKKIFHRIQDYPYLDLFAFQDLYFMETMSCGSEWACFDGTQWTYHRLNGATGSGRLLNATGGTVWSGPLQVQPTQNPSDGYFGIGHATKSLTTATSLQPWPGGNDNDYVLNLRTLGLYRFESTFVDPATHVSTTNSISRVLGAPLADNFRGVWGGVLGHTTGTIYLNHEGYATEPGIPVTNGAFAATRTWAGVANARTGGRDSVPGRVFATFVDGQTGLSYTAQRNIDYGSVNGNQMFLFDFTATGTDTTPPTVSISSPAGGAKLTGTTTITAAAADNVGVTKVELLMDGKIVVTDTTAPYSTSWNAATATLGAHTVTAKAYDKAGNTTAAAPVSVNVVDTALPTLTISKPTNGSKVTRSSTVTITATASDNRGVARVQFSVNNVLKCTDTTSAYSCAWAVPATKGVTYTIRVRATDASNNFVEKVVTVSSK